MTGDVGGDVGISVRNADAITAQKVQDLTWRKSDGFVREFPMADRQGNKVPRGSAMYMGEPDGPMRWIKSLGMEVPTYIDPRNDLKSTYKSASAHVSIDYHVPPRFRGPYVPQGLADYDPAKHYPLTQTGKVRCGGIRADGIICQKAAQNRTPYCTNHGGALHPADKLFSSDRGVMPSTPEKLSRLQKVEMGIIPVSELTDEEILKMQVRNDDGTFSKTTQILSNRITQDMRAQFFKRTDDLLRESTLDLLNEMKRIALSAVAEDKDKIQAIQWLTERTLGKTPDVLITNKTDTPFENMMTEIVSGSRDDYRNGNQPALPGGVPIIEGEVFDPYEFDDEDDNEESNVERDGESDDQHEMVGENQVVDVGSYTDNSAKVDAAPNPQTPAEIAAARKARKDAINKARNRKYAAKSRGLDTLDDLPYDIEFKIVNMKAGPVTRMKLIAPDAQKAPKAR